MGSGLAKQGVKKQTYVCNEPVAHSKCADSSCVNQDGDGDCATTKQNSTKLSHATSNDEISKEKSAGQNAQTDITQSESDLTKRLDSACAKTQICHSEFVINKPTPRDTASNETLNSKCNPLTSVDSEKIGVPWGRRMLPKDLDLCENNIKGSVKPKRPNLIKPEKIKKKQMLHLNEWREITLKQQSDLTDHEKMQRAEEIKHSKDRTPVSPTPYSGFLEPILNLPKVVKPRKPVVSSDDEDFIDSLDWDLSKDDADFVPKGAQKYLDYASMGKMARKIKEREDAVNRSNVDAEQRKNNSNNKIPEKDLIKLAHGENSTRNNGSAMKSGDKNDGKDSYNMTDAEKREIQSNIQAEIINQLGHVEKLIFDLELL